jgi:hypothetical protein
MYLYKKYLFLFIFMLYNFSMMCQDIYSELQIKVLTSDKEIKSLRNDFDKIAVTEIIKPELSNIEKFIQGDDRFIRDVLMNLDSSDHEAFLTVRKLNEISPNRELQAELKTKLLNKIQTLIDPSELINLVNRLNFNDAIKISENRLKFEKDEYIKHKIILTLSKYNSDFAINMFLSEFELDDEKTHNREIFCNFLKYSKKENLDKVIKFVISEYSSKKFVLSNSEDVHVFDALFCLNTAEIQEFAGKIYKNSIYSDYALLCLIKNHTSEYYKDLKQILIRENERLDQLDKSYEIALEYLKVHKQDNVIKNLLLERYLKIQKFKPVENFVSFFNYNNFISLIERPEIWLKDKQYANEINIFIKKNKYNWKDWLDDLEKVGFINNLEKNELEFDYLEDPMIYSFFLPENDIFLTDHEFPGDNYPLALDKAIKKALSLKKVGLKSIPVKMKTKILENDLVEYDIMIDLDDQVLYAHIISNNWEEYENVIKILNEISKIAKLKYKFYTFNYLLPYNQIFYGSEALYAKILYYSKY